MYLETDYFEVRLARDASEIRAAQRLRYSVFVEELGASGPMVDDDLRLERDRFDPFLDHLLLIDQRRSGADRVVGVYRLMRDDQADAAGGFYSEDEYDLAPLRASGRRLLELGRSCLHAEYRGGAGLFYLWSGLASYIERHGVDLLFGVASFHGTDPAPLAGPLSLLHQRHLAPPELRARAKAPGYHRMDLTPRPELDRAAAMRAMPPLIKAYLRLGGMVGEGAWIDAPFNCIDICLILDAAKISAERRALYTAPVLGGA